MVLILKGIGFDLQDGSDYGELNRIVRAAEYDDLEKLYVSIFMNEEADYEII